MGGVTQRAGPREAAGDAFAVRVGAEGAYVVQVVKGAQDRERIALTGQLLAVGGQRRGAVLPSGRDLRSAGQGAQGRPGAVRVGEGTGLVAQGPIQRTPLPGQILDQPLEALLGGGGEAGGQVDDAGRGQGLWKDPGLVRHPELCEGCGRVRGEYRVRGVHRQSVAVSPGLRFVGGEHQVPGQTLAAQSVYPGADPLGGPAVRCGFGQAHVQGEVPVCLGASQLSMPGEPPWRRHRAELGEEDR